MGTSKSRTRKSDRVGSHCESFRVRANSLSAHPVEIWRVALKELAIAKGCEQFTTASRLCACGKPALRVWKNIGYCKAHTPERV